MGKFNSFITQLREQHKMSLGMLADRLEVHRNTQSNYETDRDPPFEYLVKLAFVLGVSFERILIKRLETCSASAEAIQHGFDTLTLPKNEKLINEPHPMCSESSELMVEVKDYWHSDIKVGSIVICDSKDKKVMPGKLYGFRNPLNKQFMVAKVEISASNIRIRFDNPLHNDLMFTIEAETDANVILMTLGLIGRITKSLVEL